MKQLSFLHPDGFREELEDLYRQENDELQAIQALPAWTQMLRSASIQYRYARKRMQVRFGRLWMYSSFR